MVYTQAQLIAHRQKYDTEALNTPVGQNFFILFKTKIFHKSSHIEASPNASPSLKSVISSVINMVVSGKVEY